MATGPVLKGARKAANAMEELEQAGVKINKYVLKDMANGSWSGQSGAFTKAAKEARKAYAQSINDFGLSSKDAWNNTMTRFRYILENTPPGELKQGGILYRK